MTRVDILPSAIRDITFARATAELLDRAAVQRVIPRVDAPSHLDVRHHYSVGPRGAYAQVLLRGPGAIAWEFGGRNRQARAPLRRAVGMVS